MNHLQIIRSLIVVMLVVFCCLLTTSCSSNDDSQGSDTDSDSNTESDTESELENDTEFSDKYFEINVSLSEKISTVAIVKWSTALEPIDGAYIEFGLDTSYGMTAPVDLDEPDYRTLLLGMKPSTDYHFRISVTDGDDTYQSDDFTITTGAVPNGLPTNITHTVDPGALQGGFTVFVFFMTCEVVIIDSDGDYVWWYFPTMSMCSRARMSYDGKHMIVRTVNVGSVMPPDVNGVPNNGRIARVTMDGLEEGTIHQGIGHHDFTVLPDNSIAFIAYDGDDCDDIMEMDSDGDIKEVFHIADAITPPNIGDGCHSNAINYWPEDDSYTVSVLNKNQILKFTRSGELLWVLGGAENDFSGDVTWENQHGHHLYDGKLLFFNNGNTGQNSRALLYSLDEANLEATQIWVYSSGNGSISMGDAQHLTGGNALVTFSNNGVIHEVDPDGNLVQEMSWDFGGGLGYAMKRDSLYGPPPK